MSERNRSLGLRRQERQEGLVRPFALVQDLYNFARENGVSTDGFFEEETVGREPVELPGEFQPLVEKHPGSYFVIAYEDRRSIRNQPGTRGQLVRLSTVANRLNTDDRTQEMDISLKDGIADRVTVAYREAIGDKSFVQVNDSADDKASRSKGHMRYTYDLNTAGHEIPRMLEYNRLDEGVFVFGGEAKAVRWVRDIRMEKADSGESTAEYEDRYIVGRSHDVRNERRGSAKVIVRGELQNPTGIDIRIGTGPDQFFEITEYEYNGIQLRVLIQNDQFTVEALSILKDDPMYAHVLGEEVDTAGFVAALQARVQMLRDEWDQPQSVYEQVGIGKSQAKAIE